MLKEKCKKKTAGTCEASGCAEPELDRAISFVLGRFIPCTTTREIEVAACGGKVAVRVCADELSLDQDCWEREQERCRSLRPKGHQDPTSWCQEQGNRRTRTFLDRCGFDPDTQTCKAEIGSTYSSLSLEDYRALKGTWVRDAAGTVRFHDAELYYPPRLCCNQPLKCDETGVTSSVVAFENIPSDLHNLLLLAKFRTATREFVNRIEPHTGRRLSSDADKKRLEPILKQHYDKAQSALYDDWNPSEGFSPDKVLEADTLLEGESRRSLRTQMKD